MIFLRKVLMTGVVVLMATAISVQAHAAAADGFTAAQKAELGQLIEEHLLAKPEMIVKALDRYQELEQKRQEEQAQSVIKQNEKQLTAPGLPSAGAAKADVTVVEFFDYNCGYCKRALPELQELLNQDKNLRIVFKDLPILGPTSVTAAQWAMAAHKQGKYFEFHTALMNFNGQKDEAQLEKIAKDLGLDVAKMKADAQGPEIKATLDSESQLAEQLGIRGTPAFIIGGELFPGYLGMEGMKDAISKARKAKKG